MMTDLHDAEAERHRAEKRRLAKRRKTGDSKGPKLTLLSVSGTVVECQLETGKQKTVTFKFDCEDLIPSEVAKNLVAENLLSDGHLETFVEMVEDIMHQVRAKPGTMPVVRHPMDKAVSNASGGSGVGLDGVEFKVGYWV